MKSNTLLLKAFSALLLVFLCLNLVKAQQLLPPVRHNWTNSMGGGSGDGMCVNVLSDKLLYINLYILVKTNNLNGVSPMRIKYNFNTPSGTITGMTPVLTAFMLQPYVDPGTGISLYRAIFPIQYGCNTDCTGPSSMFQFNLDYQLVTNEGAIYPPYPIGQYPALWPRNIFEVPSSSSVCKVYYDSKAICCPPHSMVMNDDPNGTMNEESLANLALTQTSATDTENSLGNISSSTSSRHDDFIVAPNPFYAELVAQFYIDQPGKVKFDCLDSQGRLVKSFVSDYETIGSQTSRFDLSALAPGMYYLRLSSDSGTQLVKIVKTGN